MDDHPSIADLCRPLSARVAPALRREWNGTGIDDLVPPPRVRPVVINPDPPVDDATRLQKAEASSAPLRKAYHRHDPAVARARAMVQRLCDGTRTVSDIAAASGINRRTVVDHLKALNMKALKGIPGFPVEAERRQQTAARRAQVMVMVAADLCGPDIAARFGVKTHTIHADCVALGIKLPRRKAMFSEAARVAQAARRQSRQDDLRQGRIARTEADLGKAVAKAKAALGALGLGADDITAMLHRVLVTPEIAVDGE